MLAATAVDRKDVGLAQRRMILEEHDHKQHYGLRGQRWSSGTRSGVSLRKFGQFVWHETHVFPRYRN